MIVEISLLGRASDVARQVVREGPLEPWLDVAAAALRVLPIATSMTVLYRRSASPDCLPALGSSRQTSGSYPILVR